MLTKRKVIKIEATKRKSKGKKVTAVGEGSDTPAVPYAQH
jgi:hypothetical protein